MRIGSRLRTPATTDRIPLSSTSRYPRADIHGFAKPHTPSSLNLIIMWSSPSSASRYSSVA
jgi:hypothetical protein